jgi:hypothetical protein
MQKGFTQVTLGLLGAALLSSSAFAVGPTISGLPNVFISNNTKVVPGPAVEDPGDGATAATNIYRFTAAITLADYVTNDQNNNSTVDPGELDAARWLFTESEADGSAIRTGATRRLTIAGSLGEETVPDFATITGSGDAVVGPALDFVNVALTPDLTTNGTAPAGGVEEALVTMYVSALGDTTTTVAVDSFSVFTTNDTLVAEGDLVTEPSTIYSPGYCSENMQPWFTSSAQQFGAGRMLPAPSVVLAAEYGGSATVTGDPTPDLELQTDDNPTGWTSGTGAFQFVSFQSYRRDLAGTPFVPVASDNTLVKVRWTLSADAATQAAAATDRRGTAAQIPLVRLRSGENSVFGNGQSTDLFNNNSNNSVTESGRSVSTYYFAKRGGNYVADNGLAGLGGVDNAPVEVGFYYDIVDAFSTAASAITEFPEGHRDYGLTLSKIEAFTAPVGSLTNEQVVFNQGASAVSLASGQDVPPATGLAQFNLQWWDSRNELGSGRLTLTPPEQGVIGGSDFLRFSITSGGATTTGFGGTWDASDFASVFGTDSIGVLGNNDLITVGNDKLVRVSAWLSTNVNPGASLPGRVDFNVTPFGISFARLGYFADFYGETGSPNFTPDLVSQGRAGYTEFSMSNNITHHIDTLESLEPVFGLENGAAKRVDFFFEPNVVGGTALSFRPAVQVWGFPGAAGDAVATIAANIDVNRIAVFTYDKPGEPASCDNVNN